MRLPRHQDDHRLDTKMTPMIDVVFLLLIFFVCTASFQVAEMLLPTTLATGVSTATTQASDPDLTPIQVRGLREDRRTIWDVNGRPCASPAEVGAVLRALAETDRSRPVILDVDAAVPLGDMIDVYDQCRLVGFDRIQFAARARD